MGKSTEFEKTNKGKILGFRVLGLWLIRHNGKDYEIEQGSLVFSRTIWILWHIIGTALGIYIKESFKPTTIKSKAAGGSGFGDIFMDMALLIVIFLIVGPIQLKILMRNQQWLPKILRDIKTLEKMDLGAKANNIHRNPTVSFGGYHRPRVPLPGEEVETESTSSSESLNEEDEDCCTKFNRISTKISFIGLSIVFLVSFSAAAYMQSTWDDTKDEYKLVMSLFYLVFPTLTTWLCILLIYHHSNMYTVILKMKGSSFKDPDTIRKVSDYMTQMYRIFEKMSDNIFELTLGINFAIFVSVGTISMFEILQGLLGRKGKVSAASRYSSGALATTTASTISSQIGPDQSFSDILYVVPLVWCIAHIYQVCKASDHLYHHSHHELFLKLKHLLPDLVMPIPTPKEKLDDLPFKKVECVYKTIKDWPPKVCVYGGFQVNYKILTGMMFFIFAYARVFIRIAGNPPKAGAADGMLTTLAATSSPTG